MLHDNDLSTHACTDASMKSLEQLILQVQHVQHGLFEPNQRCHPSNPTTQDSTKKSNKYFKKLLQTHTISPSTLDLLLAAKIIYYVRLCVKHSRFEYARSYSDHRLSNSDPRFLLTHDEDTTNDTMGHLDITHDIQSLSKEDESSMYTSNKEIFCAGMSLPVLMWDLHNRCSRQFMEHTHADEHEGSYERDVRAAYQYVPA